MRQYLLLFTVFLPLFAGCGQKGALILPNRTQIPAQQPADKNTEQQPEVKHPEQRS